MATCPFEFRMTANVFFFTEIIFSCSPTFFYLVEAFLDPKGFDSLCGQAET